MLQGTYLPPRRLKGEHAGYIYVARNDGRFKVGMSRRPDKRIRNIQVDSATTVSLFLSYHVPNMLGEERLLKTRFKDRSLHGEWFMLNDDDLNFIRERVEYYGNK